MNKKVAAVAAGHKIIVKWFPTIKRIKQIKQIKQITLKLLYRIQDKRQKPAERIPKYK